MATSIRLAPDTERRLDFLATQTGRTKAFYLREIIERGIEDMEDYYLAADVVEVDGVGGQHGNCDREPEHRAGVRARFPTESVDALDDPYSRAALKFSGCGIR